MKNKLKFYPVALTGLSLGVVGLSTSWAVILGNTPLYIGALIAIFFLGVMFVKNIIHPTVLLEELKNPVAGSVVPTFCMALMIVSSVVVNFIPLLGKSLWLFATVMHFVFLGFFLYFRLSKFSLAQMIPSWFVPPIGMIVAAVSGSNMGFPLVSQYVFYFGLIAYFIMLPIMFYRIIFVTPIEDTQLPSFGIMAAPPNLCLAGYLTAFQSPNIIILLILIPLALFNTSLVYVSMIRVFKIKFSPIYASYTFPLAIGATAMIKLTNYLNSFNSEFGAIFKNIFTFELIIATIVILYVFVRMLHWVHINIHSK